MTVGFLDIVLIVLFFQILSLVPFLFFHKNNNNSNKFLALFLLAKALCITNFLSLRMQDTFLAWFPHIFYFGSSFTILWGPLLYFYVKSLAHQNFRLRKIDAVHFLPFTVHFLYLFINFHIHSADVKRVIVMDGSFITSNFFIVYGVITNVLILVYTIASFFIVYDYHKQIKNSLSSINSIKLSWMVFVLSGFTIKWGLDVWHVYAGLIFNNWSMVALAASRVTLFLFINIMIFNGLKHPQIFSEMLQEIKTRKLSLSKDITEQYREKLKNFMESEKPYLDPEITLVELAHQVGIPQRSLSEVINNAIGQNFYDFINSYRIKESQQLLMDHSQDSVTVLEVLYKVGYNSKSSFNNAFKKYAGMTPSQFKALHSA